MRIVAIIPARMGSSRFPGKPLTKICGKTMIEHVYKRTLMTKILNDVFVATCDKEITDEVLNFGGKTVMTSPKHDRCTDRIAEAASKINADIVVNVQGDEPLVTPEIVELSVKPILENENVYCTNPIGIIKSDDEFYSKNTIKVVIDRNMNAIYMSREPIPTYSKGVKFDWYKQICIISFTKKFLLKYAKLEPTPLEKAESIDMNRVIEHGYKIRTIISKYESYAVDTPDDKKRVESLMKKDLLYSKYT
jgi:3-deoxy-manno-octulosonate cytidylyltransferase (CMP-KDO synthetase)